MMNRLLWSIRFLQGPFIYILFSRLKFVTMISTRDREYFKTRKLFNLILLHIMGSMTCNDFYDNVINNTTPT